MRANALSKEQAGGLFFSPISLTTRQFYFRIEVNVRLLAQLLEAGAEVADLTPIRTQLQLLERYWHYRVVRSDGLRDAREAVLRKAVESMLAARMLRADRASLADPAASLVLNDLLSCQVLVEWQRAPAAAPESSVLAFQHHVLFDYAAEVLMLRGEPSLLAHRLSRDPELAIFLQPSLVLHFRHLWSMAADRGIFWQTAMAVLREEGTPEIGKLIGPGVAADLAENLRDLEYLCAQLERPGVDDRRAAESALGHVVGALLATPSDGRSIVGPRAGPWSEFAERVSRHLSAASAYPARSLLALITAEPDKLTEPQRVWCGRAARNLLRFAWSAVPRDRRLVIPAIQSVCRTLESDREESCELLRYAFEPGHLAEHGFEEMPCIAREAKRLLSIAPDFVAEIYRIVFAFREESDAVTPFGDSSILAMSSNRRQDYQSALYELARQFPAFLAQAPLTATTTLIASVEAYVSRKRQRSIAESDVQSFQFRRKTAGLRSDLSVVWDAEGLSHQDDVERMLGEFEHYLSGLAERQDADQIGQVLDVIAGSNRAAILWRRLLFIASRFPATVGRQVKELAWAVPVLTCPDTSVPAGEFLRAAFPHLAEEERRTAELAILSIPATDAEEHREASRRTRDRLLGCLDRNLILSPEARRIVDGLSTAGRLPPNLAPVSFTSSTQASGEEDFLAQQGVPVDAEPNRRMRVQERPAREFADKHINSVPNSSEVADVLPTLQALRAELEQSAVSGVHPKQRDYAAVTLAAACARVAKSESLSCTDGGGILVREMLLSASRSPDPQYREEMDEHFDGSPSWSPSARGEAAAGLTILLRHSSCATEDVLQAVERLSCDPVPAVRLQVAMNLVSLYETAPEVMWRTLERFHREERRLGILSLLVSGPLNALAGRHADRVAPMVDGVFQRTRLVQRAEAVSEACVGLFMALHIWHDDRVSFESLARMIGDLRTEPSAACHIPRFVRAPLTCGPVHPPDGMQDAARRRTLALVDRLLKAAISALNEIRASVATLPADQWPEEQRNRVQALARLIDNVGTEIYFASGAYQRPAGGGARTGAGVDPERERFYKEAAPILDSVCEIGLLPSLTHHVIETLESFIPIDPKGVFMRVRRVLQVSTAGSYQYESLGVDLFVRVVERYLADHRALLQEDEACRAALRESLDVFVRVGWPAARRLTYRLSEVFR